MTRALPIILIFGVLFAGAVIYAMTQGESGTDDETRSVPIDISDTARWPWKLQRALDLAGLDWEDVEGRVYQSRRMCERHKREIMQTTNRLHRCKRR